ncbi:putative ribosomal RNA small subunit methyltransferase B [Nymphon striatum]|nr:putative ribosomal RNA small subunit methyltransferase B [Nymphon striatum]
MCWDWPTIRELLIRFLGRFRHCRLCHPKTAHARIVLRLETLRGIERADRLLEPHLRKNPPLRVRNLLRLATVELCTGGAGHGIVNEAVNITAKARKTKHLKGLVNAVLRKIGDEGPDAWNKMRIPRMPDWLRGPLVDAYGKDVMSAMEAAHFQGAPVDLSCKSDPEKWAETLGGTVLPTGSVRLSKPGQITALAGYDAGDWWVQDAAAAMPAKILNAQSGETVLDMCAAPGGKTNADGQCRGKSHRVGYLGKSHGARSRKSGPYQAWRRSGCWRRFGPSGPV